MKKLIAVTVSVNYTDFLLYTLEENHKLFDRWIVVTDLKDKATPLICAHYKNVECIQTNAFYREGASFNKYAGINEGLHLIPPEEDAYILFLDSDIVLHYETRRVLLSLEERGVITQDSIYGIDRLNIQGLKRWEQYKIGPTVLKENWLLHTQGIEFGARLVHYYGHEGENGRFEGWRPLGFFQLAHRSSFSVYPQDHTAADHCDLLFCRLYPRNKRVLIPEIFAIHLESPKAHKAINWWGRKSVPFDWEPTSTTTTSTTNRTITSYEPPKEDIIQILSQGDPSPFNLLLQWVQKIITLFKEFITWLFTSSTTTTTTTLNHYY